MIEYTAYLQGYDAYTYGKSIRKNPYYANTENGKEWKRGWKKAESQVKKVKK